MTDDRDVLAELQSAMETFEERYRTYGPGWEQYGDLMIAMFPDGLKLETREDFNRFGALSMLLSKMTRYCKSFEEGGHKDSAHDMQPYAAMLSILTKGEQE